MKSKSILVVDDDALICETLKDYLTEFNFKFITLAYTKEAALQLIHNQDFDLVLLDIRLKGLTDGIEVAQVLSHKNRPFIFITAHSDVEMTKKMLSTRASGFVSKPIRKEELIVNITMILKRYELEIANHIVIPNGLESIYINPNDIHYIQSNGNYLVIHTDAKTFSIRSTIQKLLPTLDQELFIQTHRSYLVNILSIEKINANELQLKNKLKLPLSRTYATTVKQVFSEKLI